MLLTRTILIFFLAAGPAFFLPSFVFASEDMDKIIQQDEIFFIKQDQCCLKADLFEGRFKQLELRLQEVHLKSLEEKQALAKEKELLQEQVNALLADQQKAVARNAWNGVAQKKLVYLEGLEKEKDLLSADLEASRAEAKRAHVEILSLNDKLKAALHKIDIMEGLKKSSESKYAAMAKQLTDAEKERERSLRKVKENLRSEADALASTLDASKFEVEQKIQQIQALHKEKAGLVQMLKDQKAAYDKLEQQRRGTQNALDALELSVKEQVNAAKSACLKNQP